MRRAFAVLSLCVGLSSTALSASEATFIVPANDGYGIAECMTGGLACGKMVADSWCEAQGYAKAVSFREIQPEETTGSVQKVASAPKPAPIAIVCTN
ncbi:hypothetical protein AB4072_01590 [Microvirga sp. 2MCAF38]|uniref:hypothetical protein n=1 Tax=Microvirga sp. 2MCAF38 TaxID=3232989 RepID=UPI003F9ABADD